MKLPRRLGNPPPTIIPGISVSPSRRSGPSRDVTLVLGAIPQESELVELALTGAKRGHLCGFPFVSGRLGGRRVVVGVTGIGKTCATMITSLFVEHFRPREVLMTGTASRINPAIRNGDVIVGEVTCNHDFGLFARSDVMEYFSAAGGPSGTTWPSSTPGDRQPPGRGVWRAIRTHVPETASQHTPSYVPRVRTGRITSGDKFGIRARLIRDIRRKLLPDILVMERGSVGLVCWYLRTPFLCIRSGSNRTQNSPDNDYRKLSPFASRQAALFTISLVRELAV